MILIIIIIIIIIIIMTDNNNNNKTRGHGLTTLIRRLYHYIRNFCNLIGLEQWYFSSI